MDLGAEVSEKKDGRLVGSDKNRPNESFEIFHHVAFPVRSVRKRVDKIGTAKGSAYGVSSVSSSIITKSVTSGRWCALQYPK